MANKRMIVKALCTGHGSEARSATCGMEHGCIYFEINGITYRAFESKSIKAQNFKDGTEYDISFIPKHDSPRLLAYARAI